MLNKTFPQDSFYRSLQICYTYLEGPGVGNTLCIQTADSCAYQLNKIHGRSSGYSADVCNDIETCRQVLLDFDYTTSEIDKLCFRKFWNGAECKTPRPGSSECGGWVNKSRLEIESIGADCSDVEPCAKGFCRIAPFEFFSVPEVTFPYYPECSSDETLLTSGTSLDIALSQALKFTMILSTWFALTMR